MEKLLDKVLKESNPASDRGQGLSFSCSEVEIEVEAGQKVAGSFKITTDQKYKPEGYVYSTDIRMIVKTAFFKGLEQEVFFSYNSEGLESGETYEGKFAIVSNLGEVLLPYRVHVTSKFPSSSVGVVKNLFHFANLAQSSWEEAKELFYSKQFQNILIGNDREYLSLYRGLSVDSGSDHNMDEFLQKAKKKTRMSFKIDKDKFEISNPSQGKSYSIDVISEGWGVNDISVTSVGGFIALSDDFIHFGQETEDIHKLEFELVTSGLHAGSNRGKIILEDSINRYEISVTVICKTNSKTEHSPKLLQRFELMRLYTKYRIGKISKNDWLKACNQLVGISIQKDSNDIESRLYQAQLLYVEKRADDAAKILERVGAMLDQYETTPEMEGYYYYLMSLGCRNSDAYKKYCNKVELLHVQNMDSHILSLLVLKMQDDSEKYDEKVFGQLKDIYYAGGNSPLLFIMTLQIMLRSVNVMSELSDFEIAFLTFSMRQGALTKDIRNRFVFLCSKIVAFSDEIFRLLTYCYDADPKDDTLTAIVTLLMKGNKTDNEYFVWYEKAVFLELRISRLYEYFLMSIDMNYTGELPKLVLMFFAYRSGLSYERNAFLYANVLKHKNAYQEIYTDYYPSIEEFAVEQLSKGRVNENLAYIYETVLGDKLVEAKYASSYADLCFRNRITIHSSKMKKVVVVTQHIDEEVSYDLYGEVLELPLLPMESCILLEDSYGNRYADESMYDKKVIIENPYRLDDVMENASTDIYTAIYRADLCEDGLRFTKRNEHALLWLVSCDQIDEEYRKEVMITLLNNYFEKDEIGRLDEILGQIDPYMLTASDRETCIRILVARGMYDRAFELIKMFGPEQMDDKILVRLCDRLLARTDYEYEFELLKVCEWLFNKSKYDEGILKYMAMYSENVSTELKNIWRSADSFGMDVRRLLENMLIQTLYSGAQIGEEPNIFLTYIQEGANSTLEKKYLEKLCYDYFAEDRPINDGVLDRINYHDQMEEVLSVFCYLSYLKYDAKLFKDKGLDTKERATVERYLKMILGNHIFLPFFTDFAEIYPPLMMYMDKQYIEYKGHEESKVIIHYVIEKNGQATDYMRDEMSHVIGGIFLKAFTLFAGEKVKYYITEEGLRQEKLTKTDSIEYKELSDGMGKRRYDWINTLAKDFIEDKSEFISKLEEYDKKRYMVNNLFEVEITRGASNDQGY